MLVRALAACSIALCFAAGCHGDPTPQLDCSTPIPFTQWGQDAAHSGTTCAAGQPLARPLADLVYDPFVEQQQAEASGDLLVHYQATLIDGDDVFMSFKAGHYVSCNPPGKGVPAPCGPDAWNAQTWGEKRYAWSGGALTETWSYTSDWKPPPHGGPLDWEPVFHGALDAAFIYVPALGGAVARVDRSTGREVSRITYQSGSVDPDSYVAGPVVVAPDGSVLYNVLKLDHADPWGKDPQAWIVKAAPGAAAQVVPYASLIVGAPAASDQCKRAFPFKKGDPPLPPPDVNGQPAAPPSGRCGPQRPGLNVAPAVGSDGTIFVVSRAHYNRRYSYIAALNPDLTPRWATSLRDYLNDGCGVLVPADGADGNCSTGARLGVDPFTNEKPAGAVLDDSSAAPVALPDGAVLYGAHNGYNAARGHLFKLDARGRITATYDFGWDTTPAFFKHDGTYSIVIKDNHYETGPYRISQLNAQLQREWSFASTQTQSCERLADQSLKCVEDHPKGFEWCVNAPVVDRAGVVYANSEDGYLYAIGQGGKLKGRIFLKLALGAAYTPLSLDASGRIYTQNDGHLFVVGR